MEAIRINKLMAERGLSTRRAADELIAAGKVFVDGKPAKLGAKANPDAVIEIRDPEGTHTEHFEYRAYYKPKGVVTHSAKNKQKEVRKVSGYSNLFPVGRLDKESEGLLVLTNDGRVTERLLHPRHQHEKEYFVEFTGRFPKNGEAMLLEGVEDKGETLGAKKVVLVDRKHLALTLTEGKKHQVRRMLTALGLEVVILKRTRIMGILLGALKPNQSRALTGKALQGFLRDINL